jgi:sulfatase modifying factor 1
MLGWVWFIASGCFSTTPRCPADMVFIPAGPAIIGVSEPLSWQQARHEAALPGYCIDTYEHPNRAGEPSTAQVTWSQARDACAAIGKRLCGSDEWERACRGPEGRRYVYGDTRDPAACNTPIEGGGPQPSLPPTEAGAWPRCRSPEGVYDLNGSLSEWVSDPWTGDPEPFNREARVDPETWRVLRGGTMWSQTFYGQDCTSRHGHEVSFHNIDDGFRCCRDAD